MYVYVKYCTHTHTHTHTHMQGLNIIYNHDLLEEQKAESIFTPARIKAMCETEAVVTTHPLYSFFCQV